MKIRIYDCEEGIENLKERIADWVMDDPCENSDYILLGMKVIDELKEIKDNNGEKEIVTFEEYHNLLEDLDLFEYEITNAGTGIKLLN